MKLDDEEGRALRQYWEGVAIDFNHLPPSQVTEVPWLYAYREDDSEDLTEKSGKWLIYGKDLDMQWTLVKAATEAGRLGPKSKVFTAVPNPVYKKPVICVYTDDCDDEADVMRVRAELRQLGFTLELFYKEDTKTREGVYARKGDRNIAKYRG